MCCDLAGVLLLLPGPCHQGEEEGAGGVGQVDLLPHDHDDNDNDVVLRLADERELACRRTAAALLLTSLEDALLRSGSTFVILTITVIKSTMMTRKGGDRQLADLAGPKENHSSSPQVKLQSCLSIPSAGDRILILNGRGGQSNNQETVTVWSV